MRHSKKPRCIIEVLCSQQALSSSRVFLQPFPYESFPAESDDEISDTTAGGSVGVSSESKKDHQQCTNSMKFARQPFFAIKALIGWSKNDGALASHKYTRGDVRNKRRQGCGDPR